MGRETGFSESMRAYRQAKGLCFVCRDKWNKTHKCPDHVPLHVIEELMDLLPGSDSFGQPDSNTDSGPDDLMLIAVVTPTASTPRGSQSKCTIRLPGAVGNIIS